MSLENPLPDTVSASLEARLAPFSSHVTSLPAGPAARHSLEDLDVETSRAMSPQRDPGLRLLPSLKLLVAALGAGNAVVPMGDNSRAARLLSEYARSLQVG